MRAHAGRRVAIYDLDKQRSAHRWAQARTGNGVEPSIRSISGFLQINAGEDPLPVGRALIKDLRETASQYDDVLIDVGGEDNPAMRFAMLVADAMFIPLAPAQFDVWGLADLGKVMNDVTSSRGDDFKPVVFPALVSTQTNERAEYDQVRETYKNFAWADGVMVCHRSAYRKTMGAGRGLFDIPRPDPKARSEMVALYKLVFREDFRRAATPNEKAA
jgi:chromosome partitioning protein